MGWVREEMDRVLAQYDKHPMRAMLPDALLEQVRGKLESLVEAEFNHDQGMLASVSAQSEPLRNEIQTRMSALTRSGWDVLRPAFQAEEWKLIAAGALLGLGAGFFQLIYLFGEVWAKTFISRRALIQSVVGNILSPARFSTQVDNPSVKVLISFKYPGSRSPPIRSSPQQSRGPENASSREQSLDRV